MSYAEVRNIDVTEIPVIDIAPLFGDAPDFMGVGEQIRRAATAVGFFYVSGHCIDESLMRRAFAMAHEFFAREEAENAMKSMIDRWLADRDFVTREEFDAVRAMAQKAREENAALEARLAEIEAQLNK